MYKIEKQKLSIKNVKGWGNEVYKAHFLNDVEIGYYLPRKTEEHNKKRFYELVTNVIINLNICYNIYIKGQKWKN